MKSKGYFVLHAHSIVEIADKETLEKYVKFLLSNQKEAAEELLKTNSLQMEVENETMNAQYTFQIDLNVGTDNVQ